MWLHPAFPAKARCRWKLLPTTGPSARLASAASGSCTGYSAEISRRWSFLCAFQIVVEQPIPQVACLESGGSYIRIVDTGHCVFVSALGFATNWTATRPPTARTPCPEEDVVRRPLCCLFFFAFGACSPQVSGCMCRIPHGLPPPQRCRSCHYMP